ncbi:MAG: hypothetical protein KC431_25335 [Myxococcales bacterium]|nr:hypothetical protein [Myxococcales bacterium]MCA9700875.1 hypothetical protein [Myxococcales bacterium]
MSEAQRKLDGDEKGRDWGWLALVCGLASLAWAVTILLPQTSADLPAWPAASVGVFALIFSRLPGRALPRGLGAFAGAVGLLVGVGKILALWGLLELLG